MLAWGSSSSQEFNLCATPGALKDLKIKSSASALSIQFLSHQHHHAPAIMTITVLQWHSPACPFCLQWEKNQDVPQTSLLRRQNRKWKLSVFKNDISPVRFLPMYTTKMKSFGVRYLCTYEDIVLRFRSSPKKRGLLYSFSWSPYITGCYKLCGKGLPFFFPLDISYKVSSSLPVVLQWTCSRKSR